MVVGPLTTKTYYKVVILHAIVFAICFLFAGLGCGHTNDRVIITVNQTPETGKNQTAKEEQKTVPYWMTGFVLGGVNVFLCLLSLDVYRLTTKGVYTAERKQCAKDRDGLYRLIMLPGTVWGISGAAMSGIFGICSHAADKTCYYAYTNFAANKAFAIILIVIHCLWFIIALDLCSATKAVEAKIGSITVGTNFDSSRSAASTTRRQRQANSSSTAQSGASQPPGTTSQASGATPQAPAAPPKTPPIDTASPPPSYDVAMATPYMITDSNPPPYTSGANAHPEDLYSGSAFPDGTPTVAHAQQ